MTRPRTDWIRLVIASAPVYLLLAERDAGGTFHPATIAVWYQLDQIDTIFADGGDMPVILSHVFAHMDAMDDPTRILDQHFHARPDTDRADHLEAVERRKTHGRIRGNVGIFLEKRLVLG